MLQRLLPSLFLGLTLLLGGCQGPTRTFTGFTFGGGGNTFNCEPATWHADGKSFELVSGGSGTTSITLKGQTAPTSGQSLELSEATVQVRPNRKSQASFRADISCCRLKKGTSFTARSTLKQNYPTAESFP